METLYIKKTISNKQILAYSEQLFGKYKGIAQQYLFYYARENKIGKQIKRISKASLISKRSYY